MPIYLPAVSFAILQIQNLESHALYMERIFHHSNKSYPTSNIDNLCILQMTFQHFQFKFARCTASESFSRENRRKKENVNMSKTAG